MERQHHEVVEVERPLRFQRVLVRVVERAPALVDLRLARNGVRLGLRVRNHVERIGDAQLFLVDVKLVHRALHDGARVASVEDYERIGIAELFKRFVAAVQEAQAVGVEGGDLQSAELAVEYRLGAALHLARRLVRKGQRKYAPRAHAHLAHEVGYLRRQHLRLAAARAREHDLRPAAVLHRLALSRV